MDNEKLEQWKDGVFEHCYSIDTIISDRQILKEKMITHLSQFFEWDTIVFHNRFDNIVMYWKYGTDPIIKTSNLNELGMDFIISNEFHSDMGQCNKITLYPFGIEEGTFIED